MKSVIYICGCIFLMSSVAFTEFNSRVFSGCLAPLVESGAAGKGGKAAVATSSSPSVTEGPHEVSVSESRVTASRPERSVLFMCRKTNMAASYARSAVCHAENQLVQYDEF